MNQKNVKKEEKVSFLEFEKNKTKNEQKNDSNLPSVLDLCDVTNNRFFLVPCSAIMKKARREFAKSASIKKPKTKYAPKHKKNLNQCF